MFNLRVYMYFLVPLRYIFAVNYLRFKFKLENQNLYLGMCNGGYSIVLQKTNIILHRKIPFRLTNKC